MAPTTRDTVPIEVDLSSLERSLRRPRALFSFAMSLLTTLATLAALFPLFSVLFLLVKRGSAAISFATLHELPPAAMTSGGGFGNAIVGTVVIVAIATAISVPFGILAAIYMVEFGPDTKAAAAVRFAAKVLTGLPSILAGVFAFATVVVVTGGFSAPAGGVALSLLMIPTVLLTAEEAIKRVPPRMREAAIGMGATPTQVVTRVTLPTAFPGILTGVMLAVARAAGETAPLLFTSLFSDFWMSRTHPYFMPKTLSDLMKPTASLAVLIYNFSGSPFDNQIALAWSAALALVAIVLAANLVGQSIARRSTLP
ncbi:MAG TPA: phosphate ABC transporter permease PstA [Candidatus Binataceae bacterium]|jgi:phosphate transport system permease protein|nr:phosphate ABC transporter permease PstA [Candidatus Binataceae bacterium]